METIPKLKCQLYEQLFPEDVRSMVSHHSKKIIETCMTKERGRLDYVFAIDVFEELTGEIWVYEVHEIDFYRASSIKDFLSYIIGSHDDENIPYKILVEHSVLKIYDGFLQLISCYYLTKDTCITLQTELISNSSFFKKM